MHATDDALALRTGADHVLPVVTVTTPDIVSWWADEADKDEKRVAEAIHCIERRARFQPAPGHPLAAWWGQAREIP